MHLVNILTKYTINIKQEKYFQYSVRTLYKKELKFNLKFLSLAQILE